MHPIIHQSEIFDPRPIFDTTDYELEENGTFAPLAEAPTFLGNYSERDSVDWVPKEKPNPGLQSIADQTRAYLTKVATVKPTEKMPNPYVVDDLLEDIRKDALCAFDVKDMVKAANLLQQNGLMDAPEMLLTIDEGSGKRRLKFPHLPGPTVLLAIAAQQQKNWKLVIELCLLENGELRFPEHIDLLARLAHAFNAVGRFEDTIKLFEEIEARDSAKLSMNSAFYYHYFEALNRTGNHERVITRCVQNEHIKVAKQHLNPGIVATIGNALNRAGRYDVTNKTLGRFHHPAFLNHVFFVCVLARTMMQLGHYQRIVNLLAAGGVECRFPADDECKELLQNARQRLKMSA